MPDVGIFRAHLFFASWGSWLVILGEDVPEDRRFVSVWTSTDARDGSSRHARPNGTSASVSGWWEAGDGFVVGIGSTTQAESTTEWPWTTADFVHWRPIGTPYPCAWTQPPVRSDECRPVSGRRPT